MISIAIKVNDKVNLFLLTFWLKRYGLLSNKIPIVNPISVTIGISNKLVPIILTNDSSFAETVELKSIT